MHRRKNLREFFRSRPPITINKENNQKLIIRFPKNKTSQTQKSENTNSKPQLKEQEVAEKVEISNIPENFPKTIPIYPQAKLLEAEPLTTEAKGKTTWRSPDNIEQITSFYQQEFQDNQWEILQTSPSESQEENTLIALKDDLEIVLFSYPLSTNQANNLADTEFTIEYQLTNNTVEQTAETRLSTEITQSESKLESFTTSDFSDLNETPEQLRRICQRCSSFGHFELVINKMEK